MKGAERRDELLRIIRRTGYVNASEAAVDLGVDTSTVRRDLARLAGLGLIQRRHGGAIPLRDEAEVPYDVKIGRLVAEKEAIGRFVASMVPDGASVVLDTGSTTLKVAQALVTRRGVTVITPDLRIAADLLFRPEIRLIVPGGEVLPGTSTLLSQDAVDLMLRYHADIAVIGVDAFDAEVASNLNSAVVPLKRAMMRAASRTILAVDSSKFGIRKLVNVAPLEEFDDVVTDVGFDRAVADRLPVPLHTAPARERSSLQ